MEAATSPKRKRRLRGDAASPSVDRLPPHDRGAEQGSLGCILSALRPRDCMSECLERFKRRPEVYYELPHQEVFRALMEMFDAKQPIDFITVQTKLRDNGLLDGIGGPDYLRTLENSTPSAANLSYYLDIIVEKYRLRKMMQTCAEVVARINDYQGDIEDLVWSVKSDLGAIIADEAEPVGRTYTVDDLDQFDATCDPNSLIGNRWLCRGGKLLVPAASGAGKSTLGMQILTLFALGRDFCGIQPARPLSSLILGDENDQGDLAEMFQGTRTFLNISAFEHEKEFDMLRRNLDFWHCPALTGNRFLSKVEDYLLRKPRDIVLLDPLVSFAGVDLTRQDSASQFLREGLSRISDMTGVIWIVIHHTTKTSKDPKSKSGWKASDYQYAGAGSFDLPGWARAVMTLDEATDGVYRLILAKRGDRAGAKHKDGTPTKMLWMRHATNGIYWEQIDPPAEPEPTERKGGKPSVVKDIAGSNIHGFLAGCTTEGEGLNVIAKRLEQWLATQSKDVSVRTCQRIIPALVENGKLVKTSDSTYRKGPNA